MTVERCTKCQHTLTAHVWRGFDRHECMAVGCDCTLDGTMAFDTLSRSNWPSRPERWRELWLAVYLTANANFIGWYLDCANAAVFVCAADALPELDLRPGKIMPVRDPVLDIWPVAWPPSTKFRELWLAAYLVAVHQQKIDLRITYAEDCYHCSGWYEYGHGFARELWLCCWMVGMDCVHTEAIKVILNHACREGVDRAPLRFS